MLVLLVLFGSVALVGALVLALSKTARAVTVMNVASVPQRLWMSISTVLAVAVAVGVLLGFLSLSNGFRTMLAGSGSPDVALVMRDGSADELNSGISAAQAAILETAPGLRAGPNGRPLVSNELYVTVDGIKRSTGNRANLPLRGLDPVTGLAVRPGAAIAEGRMFAPGSDEIVVGRGVAREFEGFELGKAVRIGSATWTVVGVFEAPGAVFESEIWADARVVQSLFDRGSGFSVARLGLAEPNAVAAIEAFAKADPRLNVDVQTEQAYYASLAENSFTLVDVLGWPLGITMAIGALAGALNTMYASVSARAAEIATLRIIGFSGFAAFVGTMVEALLLALAGGLMGVAVCALFFDGLTTSTLGGGFTQVVFQLTLTPELMAQGLAMALIIGLVGGFFPGLRAARQPPLLGLSQ